MHLTSVFKDVVELSKKANMFGRKGKVRVEEKKVVY